MPSQARLGAIVVEYSDPKGAEDLVEAFGAVPGLETVVVSTGPAPYVPFVRRARPIKVVHLATNPGFGAAVNRGFDKLSSDVSHVLICNTDVQVTARTVLGLYEYARSGAFALISPIILSMDGTVEWDGGSVDYYRVRIVHRRLGEAPVRRRGLEATEFVTGACTMVERNAWAMVGGMREDVFLYGEDVDFSLRLHRHGFRCGIAANLEVVHQRSRSVGLLSPLQLYLMTRNNIRLFSEWSPHRWGRVACWLIVPLRLGWQTLRRGRARIRALLWIAYGIVDARLGSAYRDNHGRAARLFREPETSS
jgi:GT2 family glycosyltransferase